MRTLLLLGLVGAVLALAGLVLAYQLIDIPVEEDARANYRTSTVFYADGTTEMGDFAKEGIDRVPLPPEQIPDSVKDAVIAAEDRSFYDNRGISVTGIGRAVYGVVTGKDLGGGSTITQQYVKNVYGDDAPTYTRKAREAIIALKIDQRDTKEKILARYLNTIYFGRGAYGIETAAEAYFGPGRTAASLTHPEAALLVGLVPAPSAWDPRNDPEKAQERYAYVMDSMVETGKITAADAAAAPDMPPTAEEVPSQTFAGPNGYVLQAVREELVRGGVPEDEIDTGGLDIVTTIDRRMQDAAIAAMNDPKAFPTEGRPPTLQAGLVSVDPGTGEIRAMYAGADYLTRSRNAVTQDEAQAGSTFKPFTLVAALEQGMSLRETLDGSSPRTFKGYTDGKGKAVPVNNFDRKSEGRVNLVQATAKSVNTAYVELNLEVGPPATRDAAVRAGVPADAVPDAPSNVLGTATVRPIDMAEAYATFAAQGVHRELHLVASATRIADGTAVYTPDPAAKQVINADVMADATVAMQAVVEQGSAERYASRLGRPAAGKTGTSQDNKAAWFNGYTAVRPDGTGGLSTTVVLFNPADGSDPAVPAGTQLEIPGFGGARQITGGTWPTAIWTQYMRQAMDGAEELEFPPGTAKSRPAPKRSATPTPTETRTEEPAPSPSSEPTEEPAPSAPESPEGGSGQDGDGQDQQDGGGQDQQDGGGDDGNGDGNDGNGNGNDGNGDSNDGNGDGNG